MSHSTNSQCVSVEYDNKCVSGLCELSAFILISSNHLMDTRYFVNMNDSVRVQ